MTKGVSEVKKLIFNQVENDNVCVQGEAFTGFQKTYFTTNENINSYLNFVNLSNCNNALTVLASGDQLFNILNKGILDIDTFDINELTEYYVFGLRMAMIEKYNYKNYLKVYNLLLDNNTSFDTLNDILYGLLPYMDLKYKRFWKDVLDYNYSLQKNKKNPLNIIRLLFFGLFNNHKYNNYVLNKEEYDNLKRNLKIAKITYSNTNAVDLHKKCNKSYDLILLSNLLDYVYTYLGMNWDFKKFINNLNKISSDKSIIFLHYIFNYYSNNFVSNQNPIHGAKNTEEILSKYPIKKIPLIEEQRVGDGMILIKK